MSYLPLPSAGHAQGIYAATRYLVDFLAEDPPYLPPLNLLLRCFHIQILALRDVAADVFDVYERRYLDQGSKLRLAQLQSSFLCARRVLGQSIRRRNLDFERQTKSIARLTVVSLDDAVMVFKTAQLVEVTQASDRIDSYRAELPLRTALGWFLEQRRFL
jgi:hypothetical protein